jgi:fluoride exporter
MPSQSPGAAGSTDPEMQPAGRWRERLFSILPVAELAIALGAILGTSVRFTASSLAGPLTTASMPLGTLAVNVGGCFLIGIAQTLFLELIQVRREVQLFVSVGFLGGLTTFSTVSVETVQLIENGALPLAAGYLLTSLFGGIMAALLGVIVAQIGYRSFRRRRGT